MAVVDTNKSSWFLMIIYYNLNSSTCKDFWNNVQSLSTSILALWLMVEDFNAISNSEESNGIGSSPLKRYRFMDWINTPEMIYLSFQVIRPPELEVSMLVPRLFSDWIEFLLSLTREFCF